MDNNLLVVLHGVSKLLLLVLYAAKLGQKYLKLILWLLLLYTKSKTVGAREVIALCF